MLQMEMKNSQAIRALLSNYIHESESIKETCREYIFNKYYEKNDMFINKTLEDIRMDLVYLENAEEFEHCQLLNDILKEFE